MRLIHRVKLVIAFFLVCVSAGCDEEPERNPPPVGSGGGPSIHESTETTGGTDTETDSDADTEPENPQKCLGFWVCMSECLGLDIEDTDDTNGSLDLCMSTCPETPVTEPSRSMWVEACDSDADKCEGWMELCVALERRE